MKRMIRIPTWVVLAALAGTFAFAWPRSAVAQEELRPPEIWFKYDLKAKLLKANQIRLRPNQEKQAVFFFLVNPNKEEPLNNVKVKLVRLGAGGEEKVLAEAEVAQVDPWEGPKNEEKAALIKFGFPSPAGKPEGKIEAPEAKKPAGPVPESLGKPPFELRFRLTVGKQAIKNPVVVPVVIRQPREYVEVEASYDDTTRTVEFVATATENFAGPPCPVDLSFEAEAVPGLFTRTKGTYNKVLHKKGDKVRLKAMALPFVETPAKPYDRIYLAIDKYNRAYTYENSYTAGQKPKELKGPRVRLRVPRFSPPDPNLSVRVEVDPPDTLPLEDSVMVEAGLDFPGEAKSSFYGARQELVAILPGDSAGGLLFQTSAQDWEMKLDASGTFGTYDIQAKLFVWEKRKTSGTGLKLKPENLWKQEQIPVIRPDQPQLFTPFGPNQTTADERAVNAQVVLDGTRPQVAIDTKALREPGYLYKGESLEIKVKTNDEESGIRKVQFFLGKPVLKGNKEEMPGNAFETRITDGGKAGTWTAEVPVETVKAALIDITVQATNGAGLTASDTITIRLKDAKEGGKGAKKGGATITGMVVVSDRPQPGAQVFLSDEKGAVKAKTTALTEEGVAKQEEEIKKSKSKKKAGKIGSFEFLEVPPGTYTITAANPALMLRGVATVNVPEGEPKVITIQIEMQRGG
jgi:hypothetical protein